MKVDSNYLSSPIQSQTDIISDPEPDWLESLAKGEISSEIETQPVQNLYAIHVQNGLIQCNFIVPQSLSDRDGRWRVGAIATLIDTIGACAAHTTHGNINVSVDFNISYFSTAKVQDEVEIEAKVMGNKGNLSSVMMVIKKKENGDLVAIGKQWMSVYDLNHKSKM
ncbi:hypothetical protein C5167_029677 [Papaver somniferum]|uniref:uncharacterized protein LOC113337985 n=1 Tax=Papaver somniferum TaxID=3469 RepID=UPI000E6FB99E|nr:uncharacterized protein LOC113337985 [Papaver somniferum]RZC90543.1 hypothetical protein C5167_029677 [Papaver somniferum]